MAFPLIIVASSLTTAATARNVALTAYVGLCMGRDIWDAGKQIYKKGKQAKASWDERQATKAQKTQQHSAQPSEQQAATA